MLGFSVAGAQVGYRRFIHLHIASAHDSGADGFVDGFEPVGCQAHPVRHRLPGEMHAVARPVDFLLPVEGKVIAILAHDDLCEQAGRGNAAILELLRQWGDERHGVEFAAPDELAPDEPKAHEARRLVVELLADFFADAAPGLRRGLDLRRFDDLLDDLQIRGPARLMAAGVRRARWVLAG